MLDPFAQPSLATARRSRAAVDPFQYARTDASRLPRPATTSRRKTVQEIEQEAFEEESKRLESEANERQKQEQAAAKAALKAQNDAAEAAFRKEGRPFYTNASGQILPTQDDETYLAEKQRKAANDAKASEYFQMSRPFRYDAQGNVVPRHTDEEWEAQKKAKAAELEADKIDKANKEYREKVRSGIDQQQAVLSSNDDLIQRRTQELQLAADNARAEVAKRKRFIEQAKKRLDEMDPADTQFDSVAAAAEKMQAELDEYQAKADAADEESRRQQAAKLSFDKDQDVLKSRLRQEEIGVDSLTAPTASAQPVTGITPVGSMPTPRPPATATPGVRDQVLAGRVAAIAKDATLDDAGRKAALTQLQLRRKDPAAYQTAVKLEFEQADVETLKPKLEQQMQAHEQRLADLQARTQAFTQKRDQVMNGVQVAFQRAQQRLAGPHTAGDLVTVPSPDGEKEISMPRDVAEGYLMSLARAKQWQDDNQDKADLLEIESDEANLDAQLLNEGVKVLNAKQQAGVQRQTAERQQQLADLAASGHETQVRQIQSLDQEADARLADIEEMYPENSPERAAAVKAVQQDIQGQQQSAVQVIQQQQAKRAKSLTSAYSAATVDLPAGMDLTAELESDPLAMNSKAADAGVEVLMQSMDLPRTLEGRKQAVNLLKDAALADWSRGDSKTPARIDSQGRVLVNPELWTDDAAFAAAVEAANTTPAAKAEALKQQPELKAQVIQAKLDTLRTLGVYQDWEAEAIEPTREEKMQALANGQQATAKLKHADLSDEEKLKRFEQENSGVFNSGAWKVRWNQALLGVGQGAIGIGQSVTGLAAPFSDDALAMNRRLSKDAQSIGAASQALPTGQWVNQGASMLVSSAPALVAGGLAEAVTGSEALALRGAAAGAGLQTFGSVYGDAVQGFEQNRGMSTAEARKAALIPALASGAATYALTAAGGTKGVESILRTKGFREGFQQWLKTVGKGALQEGVLEEAPDQLIQGALARHSYDPTKSWENIFDETVTAAIGGALMGAGFEAMNTRFAEPGNVESSKSQVSSEAVPEVPPEVPAHAAAPVSSQDLSSQEPAKAGTTNTETSKPERWAAAEAALANFAQTTTLPTEVADKTLQKGRVLLKIAQGAKADSLDNDDLHLVGLHRDDAGKITQGHMSKNGWKKGPNPNGSPQPVEVLNGEFIITQRQIERLRNKEVGLGALADAIALPAEERRAQILAKEQPSTNTNETAPQPGPAASPAVDAAQGGAQKTAQIEDAPARGGQTVDSPAAAELSPDDEIPMAWPKAAAAEGSAALPSAPAVHPILAQAGFDEPALERAGLIAAHLQDAGLSADEAAVAAGSVVKRMGVVGDDYTAQMVEDGFNQAMKEAGFQRVPHKPTRWERKPSTARPVMTEAEKVPSSKSQVASAGQPETSNLKRATPAKRAPLIERADFKQAADKAMLAEFERLRGAPDKKKAQDEVKALTAARNALVDLVDTRYAGLFDEVVVTPHGNGGGIQARALTVDPKTGRATQVALEIDPATFLRDGSRTREGIERVLNEEFAHRIDLMVSSEREGIDLAKAVHAARPGVFNAAWKQYFAVDIANGTLPALPPPELTDAQAFTLYFEATRLIHQGTFTTENAEMPDIPFMRRIYLYLTRWVQTVQREMRKLPEDLRDKWQSRIDLAESMMRKLQKAAIAADKAGLEDIEPPDSAVKKPKKSPAANDPDLDDELDAAWEAEQKARRKAPTFTPAQQALRRLRAITDPDNGKSNVISRLLPPNRIPIYSEKAKRRRRAEGKGAGDAELEWVTRSNLTPFWKGAIFESGNKQEIDPVIQQMAAEGYFPGAETADEMREMLARKISDILEQDAANKRGETTNLDEAEGEHFVKLERQRVEFERSTESGPLKVRPADLQPGDVMQVKGDDGKLHPVEVLSLETRPLEAGEDYDPQGNPGHRMGPDGPEVIESVTLKDGTTFGVQTIDGQEGLFVDEFSVKDGADFDERLREAVMSRKLDDADALLHFMDHYGMSPEMPLGEIVRQVQTRLKLPMKKAQQMLAAVFDTSAQGEGRAEVSLDSPLGAAAKRSLLEKPQYHSTPNETAAQSILQSGQVMPPALPHSRGKLTPVVGRVYMAPGTETAAIYSLGGVWMGTANADWWKGRPEREGGQYGYVFQIDPDSVQDIQPDEDNVGELAFKAMDGELPNAPYWLKSMGERLATPREKRDKWAYANYASLGKRMLKQMSDQQKLEMIERFNTNIAHAGPVRILKAWKVDKARAGELARDGSNLLDVAEPVPLPEPQTLGSARKRDATPGLFGEDTLNFLGDKNTLGLFEAPGFKSQVLSAKPEIAPEAEPMAAITQPPPNVIDRPNHMIPRYWRDEQGNVRKAKKVFRVVPGRGTNELNWFQRPTDTVVFSGTDAEARQWVQQQDGIYMEPESPVTSAPTPPSTPIYQNAQQWFDVLLKRQLRSSNDWADAVPVAEIPDVLALLANEIDGALLDAKAATTDEERRVAVNLARAYQGPAAFLMHRQTYKAPPASSSPSPQASPSPSPAFSLESPTGAELDAEARRKELREKLRARQDAPLIGTQGDIGQMDMLGGGDLFAQPGKAEGGERRAESDGLASAAKRGTVTDIAGVPATRIFQTAKERHGITFDLAEAGYVLPDGTMLDFSGRADAGYVKGADLRYRPSRAGDRDWMRGQRGVDHREVEWEGQPSYREISEPMIDFMRLGAIRMDRSGAISLHGRFLPTAAQFRVLKDLVMMADGAYVDLEDDAGKRASFSVEGAKFSRVKGLITRWSNGENLEEMQALFSARKRGDTPPPAPFYSKLAQVIETKMPARADAKTIKGIITNPQTGIKAEELKWSGMVPWLEEQARRAAGEGQRVSKQAVLDYLASDGAVRLEEVRMGGRLGDRYDPEIVRQINEITRQMHRYREDAANVYGEDRSKWPKEVSNGAEITRLKSEHSRLIRERDDKAELKETKFSQYQLPGGENYREVVLAMPEKANSADIIVEQRNDPLNGNPWVAWAKTSTGQKAHQLAIGLDENQVRQQALAELSASKGSAYTSSHFPDVPNYVAHARLNDRVDAEGRPGTFIEEIQSDRHQAGREKGYKGDFPQALFDEVVRNGADPVIARAQIEQLLKAPLSRDGGDATTFAWDFLNRFATSDLNEVFHDAPETAIPDAPFRTTWPLQMFKRALAEAVAQGKQWIGWTTGDTQAERYDLSKQVDSVLVWESVTPGFYHYEAKKDGRTLTGEQDRQGVSASKLADAIGKELADKATRDIAEGKRAEYSGESLKVGGEGMKGFYDTILPKEIGKYVKQWGAGVVKGGLTVPKKTGFDEDDVARENGMTLAQFYDLPEQAQTGLIRSHMAEKPTPIWRVDITPAMRAGVEAGQALFASRKRGEAPNRGGVGGRVGSPAVGNVVERAAWSMVDTDTESSGESAADVLRFEDVPDADLSDKQRDNLRALEAIWRQDAGAGGTAAALTYRRVSAPADARGRSLVQFARHFEDATGKKIEWVDSDPALPLPWRAAVSPQRSNTIFVHARAPGNVLALIGHEWGHTLEYQNKPLYRALQAQLAAYVTRKDYKTARAGLKDRYRRAIIRTELTNNVIGDFFTDAAFWREVERQDRGLLRQALQSVMDWFHDMAAKLGSLWGTEHVLTDVDAARQAVAAAFAEAVRQGPYSELEASEDADLVKTIDQAAHEAATSPRNDLPEPTPAQKEAGNYAKGHVRIAGHDISIENPAGSKRRPEWPALKDHYGYIRSVRVSKKDLPQAAVADAQTGGNTPDAFTGVSPSLNAGQVVNQLVAAVSNDDASISKNTANGGLRDTQQTGNLSARNALVGKLLSFLNVPRNWSRARFLAELTQATRDGLATDSKLFGDEFLGMSLRTQGFNKLDINQQAVVKRHMSAAINDPQIFRAVVQFVPVDVMNMLSAGQVFNTKNDTVLLERFAAAFDDPVMIGRVLDAVASSLPAAFALRIAERMSDAAQSPLASVQERSAKSAGNRRHADTVTRVSPKGKDGDHVDVFINPGTPEDFAGEVFAVRQIDPATGRFDEWKIMMGYSSLDEARGAYERNYTRGWKGLDSIHGLPMEEFSRLLAQGVFATAGKADAALAAASKRSGTDTKPSVKHSVAGALARTAAGAATGGAIAGPVGAVVGGALALAPVKIGSGIAKAGAAVVEKAGLQQVLAKMGSNNLDKFISNVVFGKIAKWAHVDSAKKAVEVWLGKPGALSKLAKGTLDQTVPLWNVPREWLAVYHESQRKAAWGREKAMDVIRALSHNAKVSDLAYPQEFVDDPAWRVKLFDAMEGKADMTALPQPLQDLAERLRKLLKETGQELVRQGIMSLDTFEELSATGWMPRYTEDEAEAAGGSWLKAFKLGVKDLVAQRSTAWHVVDTTRKEKDGQYAIVSRDEGGKRNRWRFRNEQHRNAWYEDFIKREAVTMLTKGGKEVTSLLAALDNDATRAVREEIKNLTREKIDRPAELSENLRNVVRRAVELQRFRYKKEAPFEPDKLIKDPVYAVARYVMGATHNAATMELLKQTAKQPEWVSDVALAGYTQMPDNDRFGPLAGKHVKDEIARQILDLVDVPGTVMGTYDAILRTWKAGKLVLNPGSHIRDAVGNVAFSVLAGTNPLNPGNLPYYRDAIAALRDGGDAYAELIEMQVLGGDAFTTEVKTALKGLLPDTKTLEKQDAGQIMRLIMGVGGAARGAYEWAAAVRQVPDNLYKTAAYLKFKAQGMSPAEAAAEVRKWFPYYDRLGSSGLIKKGSRFVMPFSSFFRESTRILGRGAVERPLAMASILGFAYVVTQLSLMMLGLGDEDEESVFRSMRGKLKLGLSGDTPVFSMLLPFRTDEGQLQQFDISSVLPFADLLGTRVEMRQGEDEWTKFWRGLFTQSPILSTAWAWSTNTDAFSGRRIVEEDMGALESTKERLREFGDTMLPPLTPWFGVHSNTIANAGRRMSSLDTRNATQSYLRAIVGLDVRSADPNLRTETEHFRKEKKLPLANDGSLYATPLKSRLGRQIKGELIQDAPDIDTVADALLRLEESGNPIKTRDDMEKLLKGLDPDRLIKEEYRRKLVQSFSPEALRVWRSQQSEFKAAQRRLPSVMKEVSPLVKARRARVSAP